MLPFSSIWLPSLLQDKRKENRGSTTGGGGGREREREREGEGEGEKIEGRRWRKHDAGREAAFSSPMVVI